MKGYIYIMEQGSDPMRGWHMNDPQLNSKRPTLGACMPNIRRLVIPGDFIFVVSGKVKDALQYVVGGFQVEEKINALTAYDRFPEYRMHLTEKGDLNGNIIVNQSGDQHALDYHDKFAQRIENYIVGRNPIALTAENEVERARAETLRKLQQLFGRVGPNPIQVMGRWHKLSPDNINALVEWLEDIKGG